MSSIYNQKNSYQFLYGDDEFCFFLFFDPFFFFDCLWMYLKPANKHTNTHTHYINALGVKVVVIENFGFIFFAATLCVCVY